MNCPEGAVDGDINLLNVPASAPSGSAVFSWRLPGCASEAVDITLL